MKRTAHTGFPSHVRSRDELEALALSLLEAAEQWTSATGARVQFPGTEGGYGADVDGLEGFARTFLIAGFVLAGRNGDDPAGLVKRYTRGLAAGVDPQGDERWPRLDEHPQAKVEAASIALILDLTRPWIWDSLDAATQQSVIDYLAPAVGDDTYPRINWVWFRLVVQTFLRSVGGPYSEQEMRDDLATHDTFVREGGWLADGAERAFDHYAGWALHLYPALWSRMEGARDLALERRESDRALLNEFLADAVHLIGGDGAPLIQGRSLIYRFAAAAPLWVGILSDVTSVGHGQLRDAALRIVSYFVRHGAPSSDGILTMGWWDTWRPLAQRYSGPGSPYWAAKGFLGLLLPPEHAVWAAPAAPLPIDQTDTVRAIAAPGWLAIGTRADGIVRVFNHGTDHEVVGSRAGDSPLYARIGYSTRTFPSLDQAAWTSPADNSVTIVDAAGLATHRAGLELTAVTTLSGDDAGVGVAASRATAHWLTPDETQQHHGSGYRGAAVDAASLSTVSVARGPWEIRCTRVDAVTEAGSERGVALRVGGWSIANGASATDQVSARVESDSVVCVLTSADGDAAFGIHSDDAPGPLGGEPARCPIVTFPRDAVAVGAWIAVAIGVAGEATALAVAPVVGIDGSTLSITWPDSHATVIELDHYCARGVVPGTLTGSTQDPRFTPAKEAQ